MRALHVRLYPLYIGIGSAYRIRRLPLAVNGWKVRNADEERVKRVPGGDDGKCKNMWIIIDCLEMFEQAGQPEVFEQAFDEHVTIMACAIAVSQCDLMTFSFAV